MAKKIKSGSYEIGRLIDQSGGMNNAVYPALLNDNEARLLKNVALDEKGTIKTCKGRRERFPEPFSNEPINGMTAYYPDMATSRLIFGAGTKLYKDVPHLIESFDGNWSEWKGNGVDKSGDGLKIEAGENDLADIIHVNREDWEVGTREDLDIDTSPGDIRLCKEGMDFVKTESTAGDFRSGIVTNLIITANGLQLGWVSNAWSIFYGKTWEEI